MPANTIVQIYQCLLAGFDDYTLDRRGDVGAWVREAAMTSLVDLTFLLLEADPALVPDICVRDLMPRLAQQANEKIDRTRGLATRLFASVLLKRDPVVPGIPAREEVVKLFPADLDEKTFQWTVESATFPIFCKLIHLDDYRERVLLGLTVSVGGLTERLVKFSSASLFNEIKSLERDGLEKIAAAIVSIFKSNQKDDRVTVLLFKFLDQILSSGHFDDLVEDEGSTFVMDLVTVIKAEISKCGDPNKLMLSVEVICGLLASADPAAVKKCLVQLSIFLCHKFPRIRKITASKLFEALLTFADREIVPEENLDDVNTILSDTDWDQDIATLRPIRNNLCDLLKIPAPAILKKIVA